MKKLLIASSLMLSMSYASSSYAAEPATIGAAAVAESAAVATAVTVGTIGVAAIAGVATAELMNHYVFNGCNNEGACDAGAEGTYTGAIFGTGGSLGALVAVGSGMSGLTAIGSSIGGGAVTGLCLLVAAPVVTAAVFGAAYYSWVDYNSDNGQTVNLQIIQPSP